MIQFTVPGAVQAQERPRFSRTGFGVKTHDAPKSRSYKELVKAVAWENKPEELMLGPLRLEVDVLSSATKKPPYKAKTSAYNEWGVTTNKETGS